MGMPWPLGMRIPAIYGRHSCAKRSKPVYVKDLFSLDGVK
jgi:hypothetical protein